MTQPVPRTWQDDADTLTPGQRWEVLCMYRRVRRNGYPERESALRMVWHIFSSKCVHAALVRDWDHAAIRAAQCAYEMVLLQRFMQRPR